MAKKKKRPLPAAEAPKTAPISKSPAPPKARGPIKKKEKREKLTPVVESSPPPAVEAVETPPPAPEKKPKKEKGKSLVIVESPAKARTINKILGTSYVVRACMGHVRDLPKRKLGIDVDKDFEPTYRPIKEKKDVLKELKALSRKAPAVYLAADPDREGEAIAWHLIEALTIPERKIHRVTFNEITKRGVLDAFQRPTIVSMDRVHAQQARRVLDRIVGYKLSPLLWKKVGRGLSAGRVQSVAVRLLVEREREVRAFKPEEYWTITAHLDSKGPFTAELTHIDEKEAAIKNGKESGALVKELERSEFKITSVEKKERREKAPPPLITSLLQQQGSTRLRFSAKRTMAIAQQLYEGVALGDEGHVGLITYMRTDSFRISQDALDECRAYIKKDLGEKYLPETPNVFATRKGAQEAHEAIRPSSALRTPESIQSFLTVDQFRVYRLIWKRFVASQMLPAEYLVTEAKISAARCTFTARGRELKFDGFTRVAGHTIRKDEQILPPLEKGQKTTLVKLDPIQHFTEPPPRYTEASIIKLLEKHGIGRPSTYAPIISTIQDRGYVRNEERKLIPTELGELVTVKLMEHFEELLDTGFTAEMEKDLDKIEEGEARWIDVLRRFYTSFSKTLDNAGEKMESVKSKVVEGESCEKCGKPIVERWNRDGKFHGCSGFPECRYTKSLQSEEAAGINCDACGAPMSVRRGRFGKFLACTKYPECKQTRSLTPRRTNIEIPKDWSQTCEKCAAPMKVRYGRRGPFIACTGYPNCKNTQPVPKEWYKKNIEAAAAAAGTAPPLPDDNATAEEESED